MLSNLVAFSCKKDGFYSVCAPWSRLQQFKFSPDDLVKTLDLTARLAALVRKPWTNLSRFHIP